MSSGAAAKMLGVPKPTLYRKCSETVVETSQCNGAKAKPMEKEEHDDNNNDKVNKDDKVDKDNEVNKDDANEVDQYDNNDKVDKDAKFGEARPMGTS